jgi:hypothetical protein
VWRNSPSRGLWFRVAVTSTTPSAITGRGHLDQTTCQEQLSLGYSRSIAAAAGCALERREIDMFSIDVTFHHNNPKKGWSPRQLEAQLKCTTQDVVKKDHVAWKLERQSYERLISTQVIVPSVLIVLVVPKNMDDWLLQSPNRLSMAGEAYWVNLRGEPAIDSGSKVVHLPRTQVFGVQPLLDMLERIGNGGVP